MKATSRVYMWPAGVSNYWEIAPNPTRVRTYGDEFTTQRWGDTVADPSSSGESQDSPEPSDS